jgi:hypothetical protein
MNILTPDGKKHDVPLPGPNASEDEKKPFEAGGNPGRS